MAPRKIVPFVLADIGEGISEVVISEWFVNEGDTVQQFDNLCDVESDKASVTITSKYNGVIVKKYTKEGDMAAVGSPLVDIDDGLDADDSVPVPVKPAEKSLPHVSTAPASAPASGVVGGVQAERKARHEILATPAVRRIAREENIDLAVVPGTGKNGRILKEDMMRFVDNPVPMVAGAQTGPAEWREPVKGAMRTMIKTMTAAAAVPHLGYCDEVVMDPLMALRTSLKPIAEQRGTKLSFLPFMIKAASLALREYPVLNARLSPDGTELIHRRAHNIGFAMATDAGLMVPNVKNVDQLSVQETADELNRIIESGRSGKVAPADLQGGSLTLSNIGTVGGTYTSPVLLLPEVVIAGLGKTQRVPRFDAHDNVVPVNIMNVSWSADHRIVDGITIASFSNTWKGYLENPQTMLLDLK